MSTPERYPEGRKLGELRPVSIETHVNAYAEGSCLIKMGNTQVLCTASIQDEVPRWLEGSGQGWITAEYSMLPRSTHTRVKRDREKVSGRTQEIQRLIGRSLRATVDLKKMGEKSIVVDCDVLQADGGTRTASITGGCVALTIALHSLEGFKDFWKETVSAVSIGMKNGNVLTDLDYAEDSSCDVDMNFVLMGEDQFIEIQGTAEKKSFNKEQMDQMTEAALAATAILREHQLAILSKLGN